jgi:hypothetical protein
MKRSEISTAWKIERVRPGFEPRPLLAFQISSGIPGNAVAGWEAQLAALPGVELAGATSHLPLDADIPNWYSPYLPEGMSENEAATPVSGLRCVTPGYLPAMGARLLEGRYFDPQDRAGSQQAPIVRFARARNLARPVGARKEDCRRARDQE